VVEEASFEFESEYFCFKEESDLDGVADAAAAADTGEASSFIGNGIGDPFMASIVDVYYEY